MKIGEYEMKTVYVTPAQMRALKALRRRGVNVQPLLREAVDIVLKKHEEKKP